MDSPNPQSVATLPRGVVAALDSEFVYMRETEKKWENPRPLCVAEELVLAEEYLRRARTEWVTNAGDEPCLDMMRKVAAILLRCFRNHGVPGRSHKHCHSDA